MRIISNPILILTGISVMALLLSSCARISPNHYPLDPAYYRDATLKADLDSLASYYPELVKLSVLGYSDTEHRPIYVLNLQTDYFRKPVLIVGQHHGDEIMGIQIAMAFAKYLTANSKDEGVKNLLDTYSFYIVPTLNPEGWHIVNSGIREWKRKNNRDTNHNGIFDIKEDGVDLNRNYPTFWYDDKPKTTDNLDYKGEAPASEPEVQALMQLADKVHFAYAFFYHSSISGNLNETLYLPWHSLKDTQRKADFENMQDVAEVYASSVPKDYKPDTYKVFTGYTSKIGNARNWFYYQHGTYAYDIEVCGKDNLGVGVEHPLADMMYKIVQKNVSAILKTLLSVQEETAEKD